MSIEITVVIPTHNGHNTLADTLGGLQHQTLPHKLFEVIVVDDGSDCSCKPLIEALDHTLNLRIFERERSSLAATRNFGAQQTRGQLICFIDDDIVLAKNALAVYRQVHLESKEPIATVGALPFPEHLRRDTFIWYLERRNHYDLFKDPKKFSGGRPNVPPLNGNSVIPKDVFDRIGGYDEFFNQYGSEDLDLGYRLEKAGVPVHYCPKAVGYHHHYKTFSQYCANQECAGESLVKLFHKHPEVKEAKNIDIVMDGYAKLPNRKKIRKAILDMTMRFSWLLALPRTAIRWGKSYYGLRSVLFYCYDWLSQYYYARGIKKGLS